MAYFKNRDANAPCEACGKSQDDRPAIFRGENWCSEDCRKLIVGEGADER